MSEKHPDSVDCDCFSTSRHVGSDEARSEVGLVCVKQWLPTCGASAQQLRGNESIQENVQYVHAQYIHMGGS